MGKFARTGDAARTCNGRSGVETMLGLPDDVHACLFDLDGVLTDTASVHRKAWKAMFDDFLRGRAQRTGKDFVPFDADADYLTYVDGKTREDGIQSWAWLLPEDTRDVDLVCGDFFGGALISATRAESSRFIA